MTEKTQYYRAEVHVRKAAGDLATYYGDAGTSPAEALASAKAQALAENPGKAIVGHRVWAAHD